MTRESRGSLKCNPKASHLKDSLSKCDSDLKALFSKSLKSSNSSETLGFNESVSNSAKSSNSSIYSSSVLQIDGKSKSCVKMTASSKSPIRSSVCSQSQSRHSLKSPSKSAQIPLVIDCSPKEKINVNSAGVNSRDAYRMLHLKNSGQCQGNDVSHHSFKIAVTSIYILM